MSIMINSANYSDYSYIIPYIRYCMEDKYQSHWELKQRKIKDYEFIFVTQGTGQFTIEDRTYDANTNDLILFKPNTLHYGNSILLPFNFLCIHFDLFVSNSTTTIETKNKFLYESVPLSPIEYQKAVLDFPEFSSLNDSSYINQLLKRIFHEYTQKNPGYNTIIKAMFTDLIVNLYRLKNSGTFQKQLLPEIQKIIDYIKENYMQKIKLSDISHHVHLQPSYISSIFKRKTGYTITEFTNIHRVATAKELLFKTDKKLEDIAHNTGFYDIHHLSKVFKRYEGLTPGQYRDISRY